MVDESEKLKGFNPNVIFEHCQRFLGGHWQTASIDDFKFKVLTQGFGNRLFLCHVELREDDIDMDCPRKILVRLYGGNVLPQDAPTRTLNATTETMVFYGLGIKGLGPKLYGTFEGGRLEEFIDSTSISVKDWCEDSRINREVAKCVADYHSQDFPLVKQPINIPVILEESYRKYVTIKDKVISLLTTEEYETAKDFFEFDALTEASWMRRVIPLINSRVLFCHTDVNRNNNLVRISDNKLVLIDYEFSSYFFRGCEIGNYFDMKMFDFGAEKFRTGYGYPSKEYREEFIKEYIKCIKINGHFTDDWDEAGRDSFDHIVMESEFGAFAVRLINIVWCLRDSIDWITITRMRRKFDPDMEFGKAFTTFVYFYRDKKKEFLETYPEFDV